MRQANRRVEKLSGKYEGYRHQVVAQFSLAYPRATKAPGPKRRLPVGCCPNMEELGLCNPEAGVRHVTPFGRYATAIKTVCNI